MPERRRIFLLISILIGTAFIAIAVSTTLLYRAALEEERTRLMETAQSQARLIEAVAHFDAIYSTDYPEGSLAATLSQIREAHENYVGFGQTGEFTLAKEENGQIVFLLSHRHFDTDVPLPVPLDSDLAAPMRQALRGLSGTLIGLDYRGQTVLAAYEPVEGLGWGIVAKIDLWEIRAPFIRAGLISAGIALVVVTLGVLLFFRVTNPLLQRLAESREYFRTTLYSIGDAVLVTDTEGHIQQMNPVAETLTGWNEAEAQGQPIQTVFQIVNEETRATVEGPVSRVLREGDIVGLANHTLLISRDGSEHPIADSGAPIRKSNGEITGVVLVFRNQSEQRKAQKALQENEERYRQLFKNMLNGFALHELIVDESGKPVDYVFLEINQAFENLIGLQRDELIGKRVTEVLPGIEKDPTDWIGRYGEVALTGQNTRFIAYAQALDRWYSVLAFSPKQGQFAAVIDDITERRQAEEALRESEAQHREIAENLPGVVFQFVMHTDTGEGYFKQAIVNDYAAQKTGITATTLTTDINTYLNSIIPEDFNRYTQVLMESARDMSSYSIEFRIRRPSDGEIFWLNARATPRKLSDNAIMWTGIAIDITERQEAYEKIQRQAAYLHALNQASQQVSRLGLVPEDVLDAIVSSLVEELGINFARLWTVDDNEEDLVLRASAGQYKNLDGKHARIKIEAHPGKMGKIARSKQPILTNQVQEDEDFDRAWAKEQGIVSFAGYPLVQDNRIRAVLIIFHTEPLPPVALDMLGSFVNQAAIALENSTLYQELESYSDFLQQAVEERTADLRQTKEQVETILQNSPDAILLLAPDGTFERVNPAFHALLGYTQEDMKSKTLSDLVVEEMHATLGRTLAQVQVEHKTPRLDVTAQRKDGTTLDAEIALAPITEGDSLLGIVCVIRDISAMKDLERLKDQFLSTAAHELRTPLVSIQGFSEILLTRELDAERQHRYLTMVNEQAVQLAQIINDLLDVSRLEAGRRLDIKKTPVNVDDLIAEALDSFRETAPDHQIIQHRLDETLLVPADSFRLTQVIRNLTSNAVKYSPEGGPITFRTRKLSGYLAVSIEDEGIGMTPAQMEHLFEPFWRADTVEQVTGGTGLGLRICQLIVNGHSGTIWAESESGVGTTFYFTLPFNDAETPTQG